MVTRVSVNPLDIPFLTGSRRGRRDSTCSGPSYLSGVDEDLAPLGVPAVVLGAMLIGGGLAALLLMTGWSRDYGSLLVIVAFVLYMSLAAALEVWGWRLIRRLRNSARRPPGGTVRSEIRR
ncbi:hypothetical protein AB0B25_11890 [Nocardia sp. NPDC049190]|uniref:hypothetical protein n=1 Tax=Nocardia sp. NPDC049190 TaxID=3155650 RepID=UPI0033C2AE7D